MFKEEKKNRINLASYPLSCWSKHADSNQKFVLGVSSGTHSEGKTLPRPCCGLTHAHAFYREVPLPHRSPCRSKWDRSLWLPSLCVWQQVGVGLFNPCSPNSWEGYRDGQFPVKISEYFELAIPHFLTGMVSPLVIAIWPWCLKRRTALDQGGNM